MGKNFSANNVSGKRRESDFYETPYSLTNLLLDNVTLNGSILEPSAGNGAIVRVLRERGYSVVSQDINTGHDFLDEIKEYDVIITNPPFSLAKEFLVKSRRLAKKSYMLLPLSYLHGKERHDLFYSEPWLKKVWVFTRYPLLGETLREDGKHNTGMMVYAWFEFDNGYEGSPTIGWLDNDPYIIRKKSESLSIGV